MRYHAIFLLLVLIAMTSCRKDPHITGCDDLNVSADFVTMGNVDNMLYRTIGITLNGDIYKPVSCLIDFENDHIPDIEITHSFSGSAGIGYHPYAGIKCLHESIHFGINLAADTTYYYIDTSYLATTPVSEQVRHYTGCDAPLVVDSIVSIHDRPAYLQTGEVFSFNENWSSSTFSITPYSYGFNNSTYETPDTVTHVFSYYDYNCSSPSGTFYIPIKKMRCGQEKLGWIKITSPAGWNSVTIDEVAIQE